MRETESLVKGNEGGKVVELVVALDCALFSCFRAALRRGPRKPVPRQILYPLSILSVMERKDIRTRSIDESILRDLSKDTFRQHLVNLEETTNAVPIAPQYFSAADWLPASPHDPNTKYSLPLVVEQRLADDFASLVAVDEGAQSVAAVCVEQHLGPPSLTLRFAALDISLNNETKTALEGWSSILSTVDADREENGSNAMKKSKYLSKSHKKPLLKDIDNLIHRAQFSYTSKEAESRLQVEKHLRDLVSTYQAFENISGNHLEDLYSLVAASFEFCSTASIQDFLIRLEAV
ncbi:hypothetical protein VE02_06803 [Pseudogymnoascus sp. 03VT05]|nr:hypothetical protein VE02_06803 [Pseudogymnoascus sp. 03VT05]